MLNDLRGKAMAIVTDFSHRSRLPPDMHDGQQVTVTIHCTLPTRYRETARQDVEQLATLVARQILDDRTIELGRVFS